MASSLFLSSTVNLESSGSLVAAQIEGLSVEDDITTLPKFMTLAASVGLGGPQTLSTYNLDSNLFERIGEGAQFEVFRHYEWNEGNGDGDTTIKGYTRNTHKIYKRISRRLYKTKNKDSLRDLRLEVQVLAQDAVRAHPNIVDIVGWGYDHPRTMFEERREDQGRYPPNEPIPVLILGEAYCSMDRFFASNVFERAQSSSWSVRCNLALGVAAGLECLRGIGVLHNDLKPENILVCRQEDPDMPFISKLADFGLSVTSVDDFRKYGRTVGWKPPESLNYDKEEHGVCSRKALFRSESYVYGLVVLYIICVGSKTAESASRRYDGSFPQFRHDRWTREKETVELLKGQTTFSATDLEKARNCYSNLEHFFLGESPQDRSDVSPKLILGDDSTYQKWSAHFQKLTSATAKLIPFKKSDGFLTGLDFYRSLRPPILEDLRANLTETFPGDLLFSMAISSLIMRASKDHAYVRKLINMSASAKSPSLVGMGVVSAVNTAIPSDGSPCDPLVEKEYVWRALASGSRTAIRAAQSMGPDMIREAQAEFRSKGGYNKESRLFQEDTLARGNLRDQLAAAQRDWGTTDVPPLIGEMLKLRTGLLHVAAMLGDVDIIRALVEAKHKDVDETNLAGETPLYKACVAGQYEAARVLIELCADACVRVGPLQVTCLHWVFNFPSDKMELIARLLLSKGLSLDAKVLPQRAKNEPDWVESHHFPFHWPIGTPLHWSAHAESQDAVDVLLRCGADVDELDIADDDRAQTPLAMAVYRGSLEMATHLSNSRANAARIDGRGCSLLSFLVADDCLYNTLNPVPKILFQWCAQGSYDRALAATKSLVQMITSAGIDVDTPRKRGNTGEFVTPLQDAAINNNAVGIIALLEAGADAEVVETYSRRLPLHIWAGNDMRSLAYPQGYIPALEMLVSRTRSKMTRDLDGETFVHSALTGVDAQNGSDFELWKRKLQVLLAHCNGLSINDCNANGTTLLLHVVSYSNMPRWNPLDAVKYLRSLGADITIKDNQGCDFLWHVAHRRHLKEEVVISAMELWYTLFPGVERRTLLDSSRNDKTGKTFLMEIAGHGYADCVKLALQSGVNLNITDKGGHTALDVAVEVGNRYRLQAMREYMKNFGKLPGGSEIYTEELFQDPTFDGGSGEGYLNSAAAASDSYKRYFSFPKIRVMLLGAGGKTGKELGEAEDAPDVKCSEQYSFEAMEVWETFRREEQPYFQLWERSYDLDDWTEWDNNLI